MQTRQVEISRASTSARLVTRFRIARPTVPIALEMIANMPTAEPPIDSASALNAGTAEMAELRRKQLRGEEVKAIEVARALGTIFKAKPCTLAPLLGLLTLRGKSYSIKDYFPFEPIFKLQVPTKMILKCGRQVSKSTSLSGSGILRSAGTPHLRTLFATPRFEQVRRLSTNYVRPFIANSLIKPLLVNEECTQAVLQRSFINQSMMFFSFAFLDVDRIRGISADITKIDEVQDMDYDFIPVIQECMSASMLGVGVTFYSGTPKTLDNGIEALWQSSTKAEWVTKCDACGYWNMASIQADLLKMIGLNTVVCAKCSKAVNPRNGRWYHIDGKNFPDFHGYHVPQVIMPMHYENPMKWKELLGKRDGRGNYAPNKFLNEVLGESADMGVKLITVTDIQKASTLGVNELQAACDRVRACRVRALGVDWGGGGEEEVSFTTAALVGLNAHTGKVECHFAFRFHSAFSHDEEAKELLRIFRGAGCHIFAHDYGGAGRVRETLMIQAGLPLDRIMNFVYVGNSTRNLVYYNAPHQGEIRGFYSLNKAGSLVLQATCIKAGVVLLPEYQSSKDVTHDMLNLIEDKHEMPKGSDIFLIRRRPKTSDDFAHSLNFACVAMWHAEQQYPDLSAIQNIKLSEEQLQWAQPPTGWQQPDPG